jgi:membrane protein implicated in regulation of membrane protease activity
MRRARRGGTAIAPFSRARERGEPKTAPGSAERDTVIAFASVEVGAVDDAESWRWIWLAATVLLAMSELAVPGTFFMLSFAFGALLATIAAFLDAALALQWLAFVGGSAVALAVLVPLGRRLVRASPDAKVGATRWEGRRAVVLEPIPPGAHATGLVRIEREQWRAESADGSEVPVGATVHVLRVDGTRVIVEPLDDAARPSTGS